MFSWFLPRPFQDPEKTLQAKFVFRLLLVMVTVCVAVGLISLLEPKNPISTTVLFYGTVISVLLTLVFLLGRGYLALASWGIICFQWLLIAGVTLYFGGLNGQHASHLTVATLLAGSLLGFRPALAVATVSSMWCAYVAYLESTASLPKQLAPYSSWNSWGSVSALGFLTTSLLWVSTERLRRMHAAAKRTAQERDEALRRSISGQKMELVGSLTSGIAHDINNLLTIIVSASSSLRAKASEQDLESQSLLEELEIATSRAALMTGQLLAFGRSPTQQIDDVDLSTAVERTGRLLTRVLGVGTNCSFQIEPGVRVRASRTGLEQIILNLAVNARDAMPEGGSLSMRVAHAGRFGLIEVSDTGHGMDEATKARVFEPFFTTKSTGTGLGLSTVRQLIEVFGGQIEVKSAPGKGTTFRLLIPLALSPEPERHTPDSISFRVSRRDGRGRILLVEDDRLVQRALARMLRAEGYDVVTASDGREALEILRDDRSFVCIVSDLVMPKMGGEALARELKVLWPELPLLLISGNQELDPEILAGLPRLFLSKPLEEAKLRRALHDLLGLP
jgi:signal transduction histidine kinase